MARSLGVSGVADLLGAAGVCSGVSFRGWLAVVASCLFSDLILVSL